LCDCPDGVAAPSVARSSTDRCLSAIDESLSDALSKVEDVMTRRFTDTIRFGVLLSPLFTSSAGSDATSVMRTLTTAVTSIWLSSCVESSSEGSLTS